MVTSARVAEASSVPGPAKITKESDLIPGMLYCLFETTEDANGETWDRDGALVYWTGESFIDEDGDERHDYWDYAVACGTKPNPDYRSEARRIKR